MPCGALKFSSQLPASLKQWCLLECIHTYCRRERAISTTTTGVINRKGTTFFICVSRPAHALISASGEKKKTKKIQRKCVPLDKFAWASTVLDSRRGRDRLLNANNSIMETDGEGKFVSFTVVIGESSLFKKNHGPAGLDCLVCRFYWSTGAAEGLIMVDSGACLRGEIPRKVFFVCDSFCGQNVNVDREGAGSPTIARSLSYARSFAMSVSVRSREREGEQTRKSGRRDLLKWTSFVFFAALQDGGLLKRSCFHQWCRRWYRWRTLLDYHISHFLSEVPCLFFSGLFFPRSRIDFPKKLEEIHKKQTSCPKNIL